MVIHQLIPSSSQQPSGLHQWNSGAGQPQNPNFQNYLSLLVTPEDASTNNPAFAQKQLLTSNIPPATITKDKFLAAIFPFEFEETTATLLFSGATLEAKPITVIYTDTKVEGQSIKLILDSGSAGSIITRQLMDQLADRATKTPIGEIADFSFEVNGIMTSIKVLVMEATQYQALVGNDWLSKTPLREKLLIKLEEEKKKPTWKAYQVSWADADHNELPLILSWNDNPKGKQKEELTWETDDLTWTDNKQKELSSWKWKKREKENTQANNTYISYTYGQQQSLTYCRPKLICIDCSKKLSLMGTCCDNNEEYQMATKFYCHNTPRVACGETFLDERMWNDILGRGGICDVFCQYMILINNWVEKKTSIEAIWRRAVQQLDSCPHNDDELWWMAIAKIESASPEEIRTIKNNPPEPIKLNWDTEPVINFLEPEEFYEHYQKLASTREKQEQRLAQLNTRLCCHYLIPSDFEYCDNCDLIYNPPPCMIYTIPEEEEPISSCALESELLINRDPDSNNDDKNTSSSSIQNGNDNKDNSNSDSNSDLNYE
ncbi:hypothetical protein G9A89_004748 [Geosiphon pyriformis]|nr:hypothetical protein G9A89_004748 [Geosiphon pyriformis]